MWPLLDSMSSYIGLHFRFCTLNLNVICVQYLVIVNISSRLWKKNNEKTRLYQKVSCCECIILYEYVVADSWRYSIGYLWLTSTVCGNFKRLWFQTKLKISERGWNATKSECFSFRMVILFLSKHVYSFKKHYVMLPHTHYQW